MENKELCFIILHYGDIEVTKKCVDSIGNLDNKDNVVVLIDNDTKKSDEERNRLNHLFKNNDKVIILRMCGNTGFSRANNEGYKYVLKNYNPEFIIVCNNDVEFAQANTYELIKKSYEETRFGVMGPDILGSKYKEHQNPHEIKLSTGERIKHAIKKNSFCLNHLDILYPFLYLYFKKVDKDLIKRSDNNLDNFDKRQEGIVLSGACFVFSKDFFKKMSLCFYPETQFYCEEQILALNCKRLDLNVVYDPSIYIYHEGEASTKSTYKNMKERLRFRLSNSIESSKIYLKMLEEE